MLLQVSLISDPRANLKFGKLYSLDLVGNVVEGAKILYNNQPIEVLLEACKQSVTVLGEPVWYSCDVNQRFSSELGVQDLEMYVVGTINKQKPTFVLYKICLCVDKIFSRCLV